MIILVIHVNGIRAVKPKRNSPVSTDSNGPETLTRSFQWVKEQAREIHIIRSDGRMQPGKNQSKFRGVGCLNPCFRTSQKESFQSFVFEAPDHEISVTRYVTRVNFRESTAKAPVNRAVWSTALSGKILSVVSIDPYLPARSSVRVRERIRPASQQKP